MYVNSATAIEILTSWPWSKDYDYRFNITRSTHTHRIQIICTHMLFHDNKSVNCCCCSEMTAISNMIIIIIFEKPL